MKSVTVTTPVGVVKVVSRTLVSGQVFLSRVEVGALGADAEPSSDALVQEGGEDAR